jgi:hypothetical protein
MIRDLTLLTLAGTVTAAKDTDGSRDAILLLNPGAGSHCFSTSEEFMPQIRIDEDVWAWLQRNAEPLVDTPNAVLRRLAGLDLHRDDAGPLSIGRGSASGSQGSGRGRVQRTNSGRRLNEQWGIGAEQALFHKDGTFYEEPSRFPCALIDRQGWVLFDSELEYRATPGLNHGKKLNVPAGIAALPSYVRH